MPRKGFIAKRDVLPDPMYNSKVVTKLINNVMEDGKSIVLWGGEDAKGDLVGDGWIITLE